MRQRTRTKKYQMALKIDMAKAYDKVEWEFLRSMLLQTGFAPGWFTLVMECDDETIWGGLIFSRLCWIQLMLVSVWGAILTPMAI